MRRQLDDGDVALAVDPHDRQSRAVYGMADDTREFWRGRVLPG